MFRKVLNSCALVGLLGSLAFFAWEYNVHIPRGLASVTKTEPVNETDLLERVPRAKLLSYTSELWKKMLVQTNFRFEYRDDEDRLAKSEEAKTLLTDALNSQYQGATVLWGRAKILLDGHPLQVDLHVSQGFSKEEREALKKGDSSKYFGVLSLTITDPSDVHAKYSVFHNIAANVFSKNLFPQDKQLYFVDWMSRGANLGSRFPKLATQIKFYNQSASDLEVLDLNTGKWLVFKNAITWQSTMPKD